ncbi:MAG TPA: FtsX-like permease family protein [Propionibacterium sp.]|nr:FtsX-like permease family protein [Propionibacterium sp.]
MLTSPRRLLSAALALALGVGFVAAALMLATSLDATLRTAAGGAIRDAKVVLTENGDVPDPLALTDEYVTRLGDVPGVERVRTVVTTQAMSPAGTHLSMFVLQTVPELTERTTLVTGRLPEAPGEVLVNQVAAQMRGWAPGDTVHLEVDDTREFTLVGVVDAGTDTTTNLEAPHVFLQMPDIHELSGRTSYTDLYVHGTGSEQELTDAIRALPETAATHARVLTAAEASDLRITQFTRGSEQLTVLLLSFGAVAVVVAGLVVANTFAILVAQRTRQLALLRTVGATRGQVFRTVLVEAGLLGLASSLVGLALGAGAVAAIAPLSRGSGVLQIEGLAIAPRDVLVPLAVGILLALGAAIVPARQATRIAPLAALRPQAATAVDPRVRQGHPLLAAAITVVGFVLLAVGAVVLPAQGVSPGLSVLVGIAGGLLSVVGVLALGRRLVPAVARLFAPGMGHLGGAPAELAAENAVRNPGRAAATTGALLVGVILVTMMTVGAATGQASIQRELDGQFPMDAQVISSGPITDAQVERARSLPEVAAATVLREGGVETADDERWLHLLGFDGDAAATFRDPDLLVGLADDTLLAGPETELADGSTVTLAGEHEVALRVVVRPGLGRTSGVTASTMLALQPDAPRSLGLRLADDADPVGAVETISAALGGDGPTVQVMSLADQRAQMQEIINTVLLVVLGLLAVAVVIAVVGIGNTLGLSVHERRQESGLLRAMGLTRDQLRASLGWEAVLLAAVAVVLGLVLGAVYGVAGVATLIASDATVVPALPWARLALIAAVALLAGWLASVLPSVRASRVPPAAALALGE